MGSAAEGLETCAFLLGTWGPLPAPLGPSPHLCLPPGAQLPESHPQLQQLPLPACEDITARTSSSYLFDVSPTKVSELQRRKGPPEGVGLSSIFPNEVFRKDPRSQVASGCFLSHSFSRPDHKALAGRCGIPFVKSLDSLVKAPTSLWRMGTKQPHCVGVWAG